VEAGLPAGLFVEVRKPIETGLDIKAHGGEDGLAALATAAKRFDGLGFVAAIEEHLFDVEDGVVLAEILAGQKIAGQKR
jgi:hypothetical protein